MVKAGAIVFAPADGGQAEILEHRDLLFSNTDEAVEKILSALEHPSLQSVLRTHLAHRTQIFSAQNFLHKTQAFIANVLNPDRASSFEVKRQAI
jgi:hypothetical protein